MLLFKIYCYAESDLLSPFLVIEMGWTKYYRHSPEQIYYSIRFSKCV